MKEQRSIDMGISSMERIGFSVAYAGNLRSCFDVIAEKKGRILILKFVRNIDAIEGSSAAALKKLSAFFDGEAMVVGSIRKGSRLEEGVRFSRHGVPCVSASSLEYVAGGGRLATAEKFVKARCKIDGSVLRRLRKISGLSMRALARASGVSKDSIYRYESGSPHAKADNLRVLEDFFGEQLSEKADTPPPGPAAPPYRRINGRLDVGFISMHSAPFAMVGKGRFRYEASVQANGRTMRKMAALYGRLSDVLGDDYSFFITAERDPRHRIHGIPALKKSELERTCNEEELIALISGRAK